MQDDRQAAARTRLGEISDETRLLADDDFEAKHTLNLEADALRQLLADEDAEATLNSWADRASRKATHTEDIELARAKASIVSPIESGGGG